MSFEHDPRWWRGYSRYAKKKKEREPVSKLVPYRLWSQLWAWHLTPFVGILAQLCNRLLLKCSKSGFLFVKLKCDIYEFLTLWLQFLGNQLQLQFHFSKHNFTLDIYFWIFKDFFQTLCIFWFFFCVKSILEFHYEEALYRVLQQVLDRNFTKRFLMWW